MLKSKTVKLKKESILKIVFLVITILLYGLSVYCTYKENIVKFEPSILTMVISALFTISFYFIVTPLFSDSKIYLIVVSVLMALLFLPIYINQLSLLLFDKTFYLYTYLYTNNLVAMLMLMFPFLCVSVWAPVLFYFAPSLFHFVLLFLMYFSPVLFYLVYFVSRYMKKRKKGDDNVKIENS